MVYHRPSGGVVVEVQRSDKISLKTSKVIRVLLVSCVLAKE